VRGREQRARVRWEVAAVKLYRVECRDGLGPWHSRDVAHVWVGPNHTTGNNQPSPYDEGLGLMSREQRCACVSLKQLRTWFGHVWDSLASEGARVVELEVDGRRVRKGEWQVVYNVEHATRLRTLDLMEE